MFCYVRRNCDVAEEWFAARREERVTLMGYNHEWAPGQHGRASAVFCLATKTDVIICQQLYWPKVPQTVEETLHWRRISKTGSRVQLRIVKKDQPRLDIRGSKFLYHYLLPVFRKRKKSTLPKVLQNLEFDDVANTMVGIENGVRSLENEVRWDKPEFTDEEVRGRYISVLRLAKDDCTAIVSLDKCLYVLCPKLIAVAVFSTPF